MPSSRSAHDVTYQAMGKAKYSSQKGRVKKMTHKMPNGMMMTDSEMKKKMKK